MSMSVDSCSTSSGCVSDLDNLSEDPSPESPDSPISSTDSLHSSTNSAIKSLPNEINKELIITETILDIKQLPEDVSEDIDEGLLEEELIDSEIIIDCSPIDCTDISHPIQVLTEDCFQSKFETRDEDNDNERTENTDCFQSFNTSFDCSSSISSSFSKAETASVKSDTSGTSGVESDHRPDIGPTNSADTDSKSAVKSHQLINGIFKEVNHCLTKKSEEISRKCSKSSNNCINNNNSNNNYICKWTHCDWPGSYDDLVDHIREIHVELQPYQQQKHNWNELNGNNCKSKTNSNNNKITNNKPKQTDNNSNNCINNSKKVESTQQYVCLWETCKVYGKASLSRNWLERHVLEQHSGPRPFKCIVEGCGARFKIQSALERHVNSHFKPSVDYSNSNCSSDVTNCCGTSSALIPNKCCANSDSNSCSIEGLSPFELHIQGRATMSAVRCKTNQTGLDCNQHFCGAINCSNGTPNKILKRKKSATKLRKKCFYVKCSEDFFDECVMEQVRYGLIQLNAQTGLDITGNQSKITFHSKVIARRENDSGEVNVLLKWEPINILPDVWVPEAQVEELKTKTVPVSTLPADCLAQLIEKNTGFERKPKIKQRRK